MPTLDEYLNGIQQRQQKTQLLESNLGDAANTNPDEFASMVKLARSSAIAVDAVPEYQDVAKANQLIKQTNVNSLIEDKPKTAQFLADPDKAKLASDDIDNFKETEGAFGTIANLFSGAGGILKAGALKGSAGVVGFVRAPIELANQAAGAILPERPFTPLTNWLEEYQKGINESAEAAIPKAESFAGKAAVGGAVSLVRNTVNLPLLFAGPQGQKAYWAATLTPVFGEEYGKAREKGLEPTRAITYATGQTQIEYITEKIPMGKLVDDLKVGSSLYKMVVNQMKSEIPGEQLATIFQDMNEWATLNPEKPFKSYLEERPGAAAETLISTMVSVGGQTTIAKGIETVTSTFQQKNDSAQRAEGIAAVIENMNKLSAANKVRSRDAETFREWIDQVSEDTPVQNVYISGEVLKQSGLDAQLKEVAPEIGAQIDQAAAMGRDVEISISDYMTKIAPTPLGDAMIDDLRAEGETMTRKEAREFMEKKSEEMQQTAEEMLRQKEFDQSFIDSAKQVETTMFDQLKDTGVYTNAASRNFATYVRDIYVTKAAAMNITPGELYAMIPYRITSNIPAADAQLFGQSINTLNPTGTTFTDYTPEVRATAPLGPNMTTLDKTSGGNPEDLVTIYRGTSGDTIQAGDFVTTNEQLAKDYAGTGKVVSMQVKKSDVVDDSTEPLGEEYIYRPGAASDILRQGQQMKRGDVAQHALLVERQARLTGQAARFTDAERNAVDKAAKDAKVSKAEIERQVREHKLAHPLKDGWAPLEFTGVTVDDNGGYELKYRAIPYGFDEDANGKTLKKGSGEWDKRTSAIAKRIRDEVRGVYDRAQAGDKNAANIIRQAGWYKEMRSRLRQEFGGLGDLFADLLGATSPNTPVRGNWESAVDLLRRASRGDFDAMMPKWVEWSNKLDAAETEFAAWFGSQVEMGISKKAIKATQEYQQRYQQVAELRKLPDDLMPHKESGAKYGFNGKNAVRAMLDLWRVVRDPNADIGIGGTAPKALNFSGNLIGFRERATIDVWAARLLQRLAGKLRIPSMAEGSVSGKMLSTGETTLTFGFGQDVFSKAVKDIRNDPQMKQDKLLSKVNDDDLQAIVWFLEKEVWTKNNWTTAAGEGGSFEYEADLTGQRDQARIRELRRIADSSASATEQQKEDAQAETTRLVEERADLRVQRDQAKKDGQKKAVTELTKQIKEIDKAIGRHKRVLDAPTPDMVLQRREAALAELNTLTRSVDRYQGGLSIQQSADTQGVDFVPTDADMARLGEDIKTSVYEADDGATVLGSKVLSTEGRYGAPERSLDLEVVTRAGFNPTPMWLKMLKAAQAADQDSTFLSRVLRHDEKIDFARHRPGVEIYFREAAAIDKVQPILDDLAKQGIEFYTVIVDGKRNPEAMAGGMPAAVGVRFQYVPEMNARYGMDDVNWEGLTVDEISTKMKEQGKLLQDLADQVSRQIEGVSFAGQFWYETEVAFKNQYQEKIDDITNRVAAGVDLAAGKQGWAGESVSEGVANAARWARESSGQGVGEGGVQPGGDVLAQSGRGAGGAGSSQPLRAADLGVTKRYGVATDGATTVTGVHYSKQPRGSLASGFYRTGLAGAESKRIAGSGDSRLGQRIHFYVDEGAGVRPEAGVGQSVHGVILQNLYDVSADPLGLRSEAAAAGMDDGGMWFNAVESAILNAGFDGVYVPGAQGKQGVAVLLGKHDVEVEQHGTHSMAGVGPYVPPPSTTRKYAMMSAEIKKFEAERAAIEAAAPTAKLANGNLVYDEQDADAIAQFFPSANAGILRQPMRGGFDPKTSTTILTKESDYSTFLHETTHFYLNMLTQLADMPNAPQQFKDDLNAVLEWTKATPEDWANWTREFNETGKMNEGMRKVHEAFAYNSEIYIATGQAPSVKMQNIFDQFAAWLRRVYKSIRDELNVVYREEHGEDLPILTGEVRQVMDRMLASEDQIIQAQTVRNMTPLYQDQAASGMDDATWAAYQALTKEAQDQSVTDLTAASLRQMRWLSNAKSRIFKEMQKQTAEIRKDVRQQVAKEVEQQPIYRALRLIKFGEEILNDGTISKVEENTKLSTSGMEDLYMGEGDKYALLDWSKLGYGKYGMLSDEGMHPDVLAERVGYQSGDQLVRALLDAKSLKEAIEEKTDQRMLDEHGDLSDPKAMEVAVERALHNEARARFVAAELRHAAKATQPVRVMIQAARMAARKIIGNKLIRDTKASEYSAAETRATRAAEKAMKEGKAEEVTKQLQNRLLNNQLTAEAAKAVQEVEAGLRYLKKVQSDASRKRVGADYSDQIDQLLARFDLNNRTLKSLDAQVSLAEWMKSQEDAGYQPEISVVMQNPAFRKNYKNMTVDEFRDLVDSVKQIEHMGRTEQNMLTAARQVAYQQARDEIVASIDENAGGRTADTRTPTTMVGRKIQSMKRFWASHIKAATVARVLDGGKDGGPMWEYFIRTANERGDKETEMRAQATEHLTKIFAPVFKLGKMEGKGIYFPTINRSLNRHARIAIAMNMGNEGNIQRLLGGEGWTMEQLQPVLDSLTRQEWTAVQQVWDYFETFRPAIAEKERRIYGKEPKWIEPRPLTVKVDGDQTMDLRGGYYPIKYDPAASVQAETGEEKEQAKRQLQGAFTSSTTRRSFTKSRVEKVEGRPLLYTLAGMYSGINDVIHDLAWHEWLIDANKLLRSTSIDKAIRTQYGPEFKKQLKVWVDDIAAGEQAIQNDGEVALNYLRQSISMAGLGFNVMSALQQVTGFNQSIVRVGLKYIGRGVSQTLKSPRDAMKMVNEKSSFMENRARTQFRELNELRNMVQDESAAMRQVRLGAYFMMMKMQRMVDVPTWLGAYEKAIGEGNDEQRSVALADQAVIDSQGGGMLKDLSRIERGGAGLKLFTVYYSYMNTVMNMATMQTMTAKSKGKLAADYAMLFIVPVVLTAVLKQAMTPGGDDEWDLEKLAKKLAAEELSYLMGTMVILREFGQAGTILFGNDKARDYSGPSGVRVVADAIQFLKQASQGEFDDAFRKASINLLGDLTGLPSAQINRTITGTKDLVQGKTDNPAAIVLGNERK